MKQLPMWLLAPVALWVLSQAEAQDTYGPPAGSYQQDAGYPTFQEPYPLGEGADAPSCGATEPGCGAGVCDAGAAGWCDCPDDASATGMLGGRLRGHLDQMHRCAAARAYILPVGPRDCTGCPSCSWGPYGDGTCAVHWFDAHADFVFLARDEISRRVDFASDGIAGPIVLSTDNLSFDEEPGFRVTGTWQISASSNIEATYLGTFNWHSKAVVTSADDSLYSVLSGFGTLPPDGFTQTDQAAVQFIDYSSDLHNVELNWRQHWVGPNYWFQGSFLMGVRYVRLREDLAYVTQVNAHVDPTPEPHLRGPAAMDYRIGTRNHLVGFQLGGDLFACVLPGLMVGGDLKAGIYGNHARQGTTVAATDLVPDLEESASDDDAAFVAEGGVMAVYQIRPWLGLRAGYELLYLDGVALAPENFNTAAPFPPLNVARSVSINDNGKAFYHGFTAGLEWLW